jgi:hypothetical protein
MSSPTGTIVYTKGGGRLGNQLYNYANLLGFQFENPQFQVFDLAFVPYVKEYGRNNLQLADVTRLNPDRFWKRLVRAFWGWDRIASTRDFYPINRFRHQSLHYFAEYHPAAQSIVGGKPHALFSIPGEQYDEFDLNKTENVNRLQSKSLTLLAGWGVRCWSLVSKHLEKIREHLQPGEPHRSVAKSFINPVQEQYDKLVGVLIRQDDYRTWNDGKYFFESDQYKRWMETYAKKFPSQNLCFIIASDEPQDERTFADDKFRLATGEAVGSGHYLENFTELLLCDEVLTPPSTFSIFAAVLGGCPVIPLHSEIESKGFERIDNPIIEGRTHPIVGQAIK